jgi:hypothetical protein
MELKPKTSPEKKSDFEEKLEGHVATLADAAI